jgi:hypothetical protein
MDDDPTRAIAAKIEFSTRDLLVANQRAAACVLQCAWKAHLVRSALWRRKKVRLLPIHALAVTH